MKRDGSITTRRGRVIYNQKTKYFKIRDFYRVWKHVLERVNEEIAEEPYKIDTLRVIRDQLIEVITPGEIWTMQTSEQKQFISVLQNLSIDLLQEIIEKIPGIPEHFERKIAETLYWGLYNIINTIIGG